MLAEHLSLTLFGVLFALTAAPADRAVEPIVLPRPERKDSISVDDALRKRRSVREFASSRIALADLGRLAWAAQGVTSPDGLRTAPSAGALYPLEVLVVASRVDGLDRGVYRYLPERHALAPLATASDTTTKELARAALDQEFLGDAAALFVITAVEARTAKKYGSRARRYVLLEAGCAAENLLLEVTALGLGAVPVGAFDDRRVSRILGLPEGEEPIIVLPVGRPR